MPNGSIRVLFICVMVGLPLQYAAHAVISELSREPWPAVVMPGFHDVWDHESAVVVTAPNLQLRFVDEAVIDIDANAILHPLPRSHHPAVLRNQFRPESISGSRSTEHGKSAATRAWLSERIDGLYPGRTPVRLDIIWSDVEYDPVEMSVDVTPRDTLVLDLL